MFQRYYQITSQIIYSLAWMAIASLPVAAQITPDDSLGQERSRLQHGVQMRGQRGDRITGGARRGENVFHSFSEFNVEAGQRVYFANPRGIESIFSRVTGAEVSEIMGTLGVEGNANLWLLNPHGILFGPDARLDIRGAFVASAANRFRFANGAEFHAADPQMPPLLTVTAPLGVQFGIGRGPVTNAAQLTVGTGQTLALHGATVENTGSLIAPAGTVQVLGDRLSLLSPTLIDVSGDRGGTVQIGGDYQGSGTLPTASHTLIAPNVSIRADALTRGDGGRVIVWADGHTGFYGDISARGGAQRGDGGFVEVSGHESLIFRGQVDLSAANGNFGTLLLDPENIIIQGAGDNDNEVNDGQIFAADGEDNTFTISEAKLEGLSGDTNVILQATNDIIIEPLEGDSLVFQPGSGLINFLGDSDENGDGDVEMRDRGDRIIARERKISISGASLLLGSIETNVDTSNTPTAGGDINLTATNGNIIAGSLVSSSLARTGDAGNGGNITIRANNGAVEIRGGGNEFGAVHTNSLIDDVDLPVFGDASVGGAVFISARDGIYIENEFSGEAINSQSASFGIGNTNDAGSVTLTTINGDINLIGEVRANSDADEGVAGAGGNIVLTANNGNIIVRGLNSASINRISGDSGVGGSIELNAGGSIRVDDIFSGSLSPGEAGNGGAVAINAANGIITESITSTSSRDGTGGAIRLTSENGTIDTTAGTLNASSIANAAGDVGLISGGDILSGAVLSAGVTGGNLLFQAGGLLSIQNADVASTSTTGLDRGGNISLAADRILLNRSRVGTFAANRAGNVRVEAAESFQLVDAGLGSFSDGQSGNIFVRADDIRIINTAASEVPDDSLLNLGFRGAGIVTSVTGAGDSGEIRVEGDRLLIQAETGVPEREQTGIATSAIGDDSGNAGNITVNVSNSTEIIGNTPGSVALRSDLETILGLIAIPTGMNSTSGGTGNVGQISVTTDRLTLRDGAGIAASVLQDGTGQGAPLIVNADEILLQGRAQLITGTLGNVAAGDVWVNANQITLRNGGLIASDTAIGSGDAGNVQINSDRLTILSGSRIGSATLGAGRGGDLEIEVAAIVVDGVSDVDGTIPSRITANAESSGDAGRLTLRTDLLRVLNGAELSVNSTGAGDAGNLLISGRSSPWVEAIQIESGGRIAANATGMGNAGTLDLAATQFTIDAGEVSVSSGEQSISGNLRLSGDRLLLQNSSRITAATASTQPGDIGGNINLQIADTISLRNNSEITSTTTGDRNAGIITLGPNRLTIQNNSRLTTNSQGRGNAGNINIVEVERLNVLEGGQISVRSEGAGNSGSLAVTADSILLHQGELTAATALSQGGNITLRVAEQLNLRNDSRISARTAGAGNAGELFIRSPQLNLISGSQIETITTGTGRAGTIEMSTTNLQIRDRNSAITAATRGSGNGGNVFIAARENLSVRDRGQITVSSQGNGIPGNVFIEAGDVFLDGQARIASDAGQAATGGNLQITAAREIRLQNDGDRIPTEITTSAEADSNGGRISLRAGRLIFAILAENSDVVAEADTGQGGFVEASAPIITGFRDFNGARTPESDFTANSQRGVDGITRNQNQNPQPSPQVQPDIPQLTQACPASGTIANRATGTSRFLNSGHGGLPPNPTESADSYSIQVPWVTLPPAGTAERNDTPNAIAEAQGWVELPDGDRLLVSQLSASTVGCPVGP
jgi:filamentous hemagglutinin family protein